ncbi:MULTISPECIES: nuclear transport factor 2 family protein [unclassified Rhizobium]|uniref:nuclear transport factor 2 family protein n=1 Tax=unclassified Rhizobium TaxID=2613769 RepID=UPI001ADCCB93|nr:MULTISPECIES: DUF4440 domain-containing protein [unclassified Rhizobium]MBO9125629.1 DUF4440 domain-containing protein [Rhizobium sp. 16-488-2b]MBO9176213.1 DUF4440 domain-containing protein [Rhizobium sp. 16-488-2a]
MNSELRDHIRLLEERLFDQTVRNTRSLLETLLSPDFREIGSSGRLYRYEEIITALLEEPSDGTTRQLTDFEIQTLASDVVLATYRSERIVQGEPPVRALRSSIWRRDANGAWRMVFHQGTPER